MPQMPQDPFSQMPSQSNQLMTMMPDLPIRQEAGMAEFLVSSDDYPDGFKEKFWWVLPRDVPLTFVDVDRKEMKLLMFDVAKIDVLCTVPYYEYDFKVETEWNLARNVYDVRLDRALGFKDASAKNERLTQQSQFNESRLFQSDMGGNAEVRDGFFKRLLSRR